MATEYIAITEEQKTRIFNCITDIKQSLPQQSPIDTGELKRMPKMNNDRFAFVTQALDQARRNPDLVPPFNNLDEAVANFEVRADLDIIHAALTEVLQQVTDLRARTGNKSYSVALGIYNVAQRGAKKGIAAMVTVAAQLKVFFERAAIDPDKKTRTSKKKSEQMEE